VDLPACGLAHRAALASDVAALFELDARLDSLKAPREAREASQSLGRRRLRVVRSIEEYRRKVQEDLTPGHQAVVTGMHCALDEIPREEALLAFAYGTAAGLVSSAMKLLPLGQTRAQALLSRLGESVEELVRAAEGLGPEDLGSFLPLLDIAAMRHEVARIRLFIS
jgi:urease accessory protein